MVISFASIALLRLHVLVIFCLLFVHRISLVHFFGLSLKKPQTSKINQSTKKQNPAPQTISSFRISVLGVKTGQKIILLPFNIHCHPDLVARKYTMDCENKFFCLEVPAHILKKNDHFCVQIPSFLHISEPLLSFCTEACSSEKQRFNFSFSILLSK